VGRELRGEVGRELREGGRELLRGEVGREWRGWEEKGGGGELKGKGVSGGVIRWR
jgi:hypothetical protein